MTDVQFDVLRARRNSSARSRPRLIERTALVLESAWFQRTVIGLIIVNAITLGLETSPTVVAAAGEILSAIDRACLLVFVGELTAKIIVYRRRFLRDPWNVFDAIVIGLALLPASGGLAVLRALRILRVLRLISAVPSMRRVVSALLQAIPGMGSIVALLGLVFYVASVIATKLYGSAFPGWFGTIGDSAYTLFQIMSLESWSMGIVRPVMETYPNAWSFFVPFILITSFAVLNLFIGIIVDAMQHQQNDDDPAPRMNGINAQDRDEIMAEIRALRAELAAARQSARTRCSALGW